MISFFRNAALTKPDGTFFCGGVLIDTKHVVTGMSPQT